MTEARETRSSRHAPRRQRRGLRWPSWMQRWPPPVRIGASVLAGVVLLGGVVAGTDIALSLGRIHPGVRIGEVPVGRMTVADATSAVAAHVARASEEPVSIQVEDATWTIAADDVALSVDATGLAGQAFEVGRGTFGEAVSQRARAIFGGMEVPLELDYADEALAGALDAIEAETTQPPIDAAVHVDGTQVTRTEPSDGLGIDREEAARAIIAAFVAEHRTVTLQLVSLAPEIDTAATEDAYQAALAMVSAPVSLYYEDKRWEVPAATIGEWVGFRRAETTSTPVLEAYIVSEEVSATILPMVAEVGRPAKDATFKASSGQVTIVPSEDGLAVDGESLTTRLETVLVRSSDRTAELTMRRVSPARTTEDAQAMGIKERIATFTTEYSPSNAPRVNNIHVLSDALNGTLIAPGEVFSFNGTIGQRTAAKGYQEANAIVGGKLVPQLGGGICQVGTTIFNTVFFSGLPVVERRNHSQYISSYPKGRDATVSWGGPDFKFKNDTDHWILVATSYSNSSVTISLYGTDPGYEVTYKTGDWTEVIAPPVREVKDATLPAGTKVIDERGVSGRTIVVTRTVTKGGSVVRTDTFKSVYRPVEEVVRVGTKPVPSETTTTPAP
ncbi:MAG: VanW family protein [Aeromicrobium sp.]|nr:VanW family protein [Aeromicrobium sp.]